VVRWEAGVAATADAAVAVPAARAIPRTALIALIRFVALREAFCEVFMLGTLGELLPALARCVADG
jgi:hypothetical protein